MSEAGIVDFAALDAGAVGAEVDASSDSSSTEVETQAIDSQVEGNEAEGSEGTEDSTEQSSDRTGKQSSDRTGNAEVVAEPKHISEALKALKADPNNSGAAKVLRDSYFGKQAYDKEFGSVSAAREVKSFLSEIAGAQGPVTLQQAREAHANTQAIVENIKTSDELVYAGDPQILDNIWEDLQSEGKQEAFAKLGGHYLDKLSAVDPDGYASAVIPHLASIAESTGLTTAIIDTWNALKSGDTEAAKKGLLGISGLVKGWQDKAGQMKQANSEEARVNAKLSEREQAVQTKEREAFRTSAATECEKTSNTSLGKELKSYLRMPFFKGFPRESLVSLGNEIKQNLYRNLESDTAYQAAMKAQWKQKSPDKAKISQIHTDKLNSIAKDLVDKTITVRYPQWAKGGSAAGRVAAAKAKTEASAKASAASIATNKPVYVATKPKELQRSNITVGGREYGQNDLTLMEIGGRGFVKGLNGTYRLITWRK